jgi:hypothetical protein
MRLDVALDENGYLFGIKSGGDEPSGSFERSTTKLCWVNGLRNRMKVDDAIKRIVFALSSHPLANCAKVVAEMKIA